MQRQPVDHDHRVRAITLTGEGTTRLMDAFTSLRDDRAALALTLKNLNRSFCAILRSG